MPAPSPSVKTRHVALPIDGPPSGAMIPLTEILLDCLARGLDVQFEARGTSMKPFIRDGDVVQVTPAQPTDLRPGVIVLALSDAGAPLVHRITARRKGPENTLLYRLRGDAHVANDGWFKPARIPGIVRRIRRGTRSFHTSNLAMLLLGRLWIVYADIRALTLRLADRLLRRSR